MAQEHGPVTDRNHPGIKRAQEHSTRRANVKAVTDAATADESNGPSGLAIGLGVAGLVATGVTLEETVGPRLLGHLFSEFTTPKAPNVVPTQGVPTIPPSHETPQPSPTVDTRAELQARFGAFLAEAQSHGYNLVPSEKLITITLPDGRTLTNTPEYVFTDATTGKTVATIGEHYDLNKETGTYQAEFSAHGEEGAGLAVALYQDQLATDAQHGKTLMLNPVALSADAQLTISDFTDTAPNGDVKHGYEYDWTGSTTGNVVDTYGQDAAPYTGGLPDGLFGKKDLHALMYDQHLSGQLTNPKNIEYLFNEQGGTKGQLKSGDAMVTGSNVGHQAVSFVSEQAGTTPTLFSINGYTVVLRA